MATMTRTNPEAAARVLQVGDLVQIDLEAGAWYTGRLHHRRGMDGWNTRYTNQWQVTLSAGNGPVYCNLNQLTWLSSSPPEEGEPTLSDRRHRLDKNLNHAYSRHSQKDGTRRDLQLLRSLRSMAQGNTENIVVKSEVQHVWFWNTLAESFDNPRHVSYATRMEDVDTNSRRRHSSWAKLLKGKARLFGSPFTDEEAERLGHLIGNYFPENYDYQFTVLRGAELVHAYQTMPYHCNSCMTGKRYVNFYGANPEKVGLIKISLSTEPFVGRALLWTTDDGAHVIDRIYPSDNGPHTVALHNWAEEQGYDYKLYQDMSDGNFRSGRKDYQVTMKTQGPGFNGHHTGFPYMDTFKYSQDNPYGEKVTLQVKEGPVTFTSTEGSWSGDSHDDDDSFAACSGCDVSLYEGDDYQERNGFYYCSDCFADRFTRLCYNDNHQHICRLAAHDLVGTCDRCGGERLNSHLYDVTTSTAGDQVYCSRCRDELTAPCAVCDRRWPVTDFTESSCPDCAIAERMRAETPALALTR